jgi:hypothetical protein
MAMHHRDSQATAADLRRCKRQLTAAGPAASFVLLHAHLRDLNFILYGRLRD